MEKTGAKDRLLGHAFIQLTAGGPMKSRAEAGHRSEMSVARTLWGPLPQASASS